MWSAPRKWSEFTPRGVRVLSQPPIEAMIVGFEPGDYVISALDRHPVMMAGVHRMEPRGLSRRATCLERFRDHLRLLTRRAAGSRMGWLARPIGSGSADPAGGLSEGGPASEDAPTRRRGRGLRAILARNVADAIRAQGGRKPRHRRERSLEAELEASSARLGAWLAAEQSTPSEQAVRHEQAVLLANALARLPRFQREALVLHYWQGCTLAEISGRLDRTTDAVAGLLKRGLKHLRLVLETQS